MYCRNLGSQLSDRRINFFHDYGAHEKMATSPRCDGQSARVAYFQRVVGTASTVGASRSSSRHSHKSEEDLGNGFSGSLVRRDYHSKGVLMVTAIYDCLISGCCDCI